MLPVLIGLGAVVLGGAVVKQITEDNYDHTESSIVCKVPIEDVPEEIRRDFDKQTVEKTTRKISAEKVPEEIRRKANRK